MARYARLQVPGRGVRLSAEGRTSGTSRRGIRAVHRGGRAIDPQLAVDAWSEADPLNDRERQGLRLAGEGKSAGDIALALH